MADIKHQIFQELDALANACANLRATAVTAGKQTDLEVAILNQQVRSLREKNARAAQMVEQSMSILEKLKKAAA